MKKIYIAGCGGMLGDAMYNVFGNEYILRCTDKLAFDDWVEFLDFRDRQVYYEDVAEFKPDYLFHIGAITSMEKCESNPDLAYLTNTLSVENAVSIANRLNIPLLYVSTSTVFDGQKSSYDDWDIPNPVTVYGRSKYMGEVYVSNHANRYLICRAGWMFGGKDKDIKIIGKLNHFIQNGDKELYAVYDKTGSPTYTYDFANTVKLLLENELWGTYNVVNRGSATRLDIVKEYVKILNLDVKVIETTSQYFQNVYTAARPSSEVLLTKKLELRGITTMRYWKEALKEYLTK
jgi:dTDP-4-dehydrorhamnose reductase